MRASAWPSLLAPSSYLSPLLFPSPNLNLRVGLYGQVDVDVEVEVVERAKGESWQESVLQ